MFNSKFSFFLISILISLTLLFSCKKDNSAVYGTQWSVNSYKFNSNNKGGVLLETDTGSIFGAATTSNDAILLVFKNKPSEGVYKVVNIQTKPSIDLYDDNECNMFITNKTGGVAAYLSLFDDAGFVNISVSGKKITATFVKIKMGYLDAVTGDVIPSYASGTIIEK